MGRVSLVLLLGLCSCSGAQDAGAVRNVLLITLDTTRADALSGDAASRALAPAIAELADGGLRFPRAYTVAPLTLPAHASILTGLVPPRHGVRDNGLVRLPAAARTLAEVLQERGFETAAFVSSVVLDRGFGFDQGFERYDQPFLMPRTAENFYVERAAPATARAAVEWLRGRKSERPFFLWVHFFDPHIPYEPPPELHERAGGDAYRGEIARVDDGVGELLAELADSGAARSTLVVLTADHGESLGEHGEPTHGALCYEATVRVPLVLRFPGAPPRPGPARRASLVDLHPTILGRLGIAPPPGLDGVDLFSSAAPKDRGVYFESFSGYLNYGWSPLCGWIDGRGKYLHSSRPEFYAELQDPAERADLADSRVRECELARARLAELLARPALERDVPAEDGALLGALAALGYATGGDPTAELPSPLEPSDRPSPGARARELEPLLRAHALFDARRFEECREIVAEIVRENPGHLMALDLLGVCLMEAQRFEEAEGVLRRRLTTGAERADTRLNLGLCRLELGDPRGALEELRAAERLSPEESAIQAALRRVHGQIGGR